MERRAGAVDRVRAQRADAEDGLKAHRRSARWKHCVLSAIAHIFVGSAEDDEMESAETAANDIVVKCLCEDLGGVRVLAAAALAAAPSGPVEFGEDCPTVQMTAAGAKLASSCPRRSCGCSRAAS